MGTGGEMLSEGICLPFWLDTTEFRDGPGKKTKYSHSILMISYYLCKKSSRDKFQVWES